MPFPFSINATLPLTLTATCKNVNINMMSSRTIEDTSDWDLEDENLQMSHAVWMFGGGEGRGRGCEPWRWARCPVFPLVAEHVRASPEQVPSFPSHGRNIWSHFASPASQNSFHLAINFDVLPTITRRSFVRSRPRRNCTYCLVKMPWWPCVRCI